MKRALLVAFACLFALVLLPAAQAESKAIPADAAYLIEANSGRVLTAQNADARLPMASTTKIMTALLAVESGRLDETVKVDCAAVGTEGSSMYLSEGETMPLIDLVYGLMLTSGNDAAVAIACALSGDVLHFVERMNTRAKELGLSNTQFRNPNGLPDPEHYTSAKDLCTLAAFAMRNETFAEIVRTQYHRTEGSILHTLKNKNKLLWEYEGGVGVKTGYTKAAGKCLVFAAERGGMLLVGVVLNCPTMWNTAKSMLDAGFARYKAKRFLDESAVFSLPVQNGVKKALSAAPISGILYPTEIEGSETFTVETELVSNLIAPIYAGTQVGTATLCRNGEPVLSVPITATETVSEAGFSYFFKKAVLDFVS